MFSFLVAIALYFAKLPVMPPVQAAVIPSASVAPVAAPVKKDPHRLGIETSARSALVVDWRTGTALFEKNADSPQPIASITKLVTALAIVGTNPDWDEPVEILGSDLRPGGVAYLAPGDVLPRRDVFTVMLVASSNEAAVALARATGLSAEEFAARMNEQARRLSMMSARFVEPSGLDAHDVASARDIAFLVRAAMDEPLIQEAVLRPAFSFKTAAGKERTVRTTDDLLGSFLAKPPYRFLGGKTGYVDSAGYCFAAAAERGEGERVIAVALGSPAKDGRFHDVKSLIYWAFDAYRWPN